MSGNGSGGPCGACKFLRRKCVKGCVFAPYFEPDDRGTVEFEAVHRVFGAKNAAKLLLRTPPNKRLDAVVSLCYEALSRVRDPVYGCVAQVFNLQQQVENLQVQLAYVQARVSMLRETCFCQLPTNQLHEFETSKSTSNSSLVSVNLGQTSTSLETSCFSSYDFEEADIEILARELVSGYQPVSKIQSPSSPR